MRQLNIQAIYPKPQLSKNALGHKRHEYLLKGLTIIKVNQAWQVDITYLKLGTRFVYLVALIDVYSRYIVGWSLSFELDTQNCLNALNIALKIGKPEIINSDLGCQFTSEEWREVLLKLNILISMDGKGRWADNIYIERFWRSVKYEAIYLNSYTDFTELYLGARGYIKFYNEERPHQSLGYLRPKDIYEKI
jgi:putative transposase